MIERRSVISLIPSIYTKNIVDLRADLNAIKEEAEIRFIGGDRRSKEVLFPANKQLRRTDFSFWLGLGLGN